MPNHVHLPMTPLLAVSRVMQSLKRFTAREGNRILGLTGRTFWQVGIRLTQVIACSECPVGQTIGVSSSATSATLEKPDRPHKTMVCPTAQYGRNLSQGDTHFARITRYIETNPVKAGLAATPEAPLVQRQAD